MANFKFESQEEKARLKERAEILKPRHTQNLVATELGWAQARPNGTLELLVSFRGLDEILGDVEPEIVDATPIEVNVLISVEHDIEEQKVEAPVETKPEPTPEVTPVVAPVVAPKKGGRPKKVVE